MTEGERVKWSPETSKAANAAASVGSADYFARAARWTILISILFPVFGLVAAYFAVRVVERGQLGRGLWLLVFAALVSSAAIGFWTRLLTG
jgi:hypothetical protein